MRSVKKLLDQWDEQQESKRQAQAELIKRFILKDVSSLTGETKTYRLTLELVATEQETILPELEFTTVLVWDSYTS